MSKTSRFKVASEDEGGADSIKLLLRMKMGLIQLGRFFSNAHLPTTYSKQNSRKPKVAKTDFLIPPKKQKVKIFLKIYLLSLKCTICPVREELQ
jgi:hypothetical protein